MSQIKQGGRSGGTKHNTGAGRFPHGSGAPGRPFHPFGRTGRTSGRYNRPSRRRRNGIGILLLMVIIVIPVLLYGMRTYLGSDTTSTPASSNATLASGAQQTPPGPVTPPEADEPDASALPEPDTPLADDASLDVQVLDVGQGLSVLLTCGETTMLYDGGGRSTSSFVVAYLKEQGIETLDYVVVSHYDSDHLAGIIGVLNVFEVETLIAPDYQADTKLFTSFQQAVQDHDLTITSPIPGETYALGAGEFQILAPISSSYENENDYSVALRVSLGDSALLLTGDAAEVSEGEMLVSGNSLQANVLLAGHHGSAGSTSEAFLEAVSPDYVVISCGKDNSYGHPAQRVMELLKANAVPLYRTDLQGTIHFILTPQGVTFEQQPCNDYTSGSELYGFLAGLVICPGQPFLTLFAPFAPFVASHSHCLVRSA